MKNTPTDDKKPSADAESARRKKPADSPAPSNGDLSSMIAEARTALREADGKLRALSAALKQHQKQFKLVRSTLSSLQQLQGIKAA
jgi:hypothetical protein